MNDKQVTPSVPPLPTHDAHISHQIWGENFQSGVGLVAYALTSMKILLYQTHFIQELRVNNRQKVLVSHLPTEVGGAMKFNVGILPAPINKNTWVTSHR